MPRQLITLYGLGSENNSWASYNTSYRHSRKLLVARANAFANGKPYVISVWRMGNIYGQPDYTVNIGDIEYWINTGKPKHKCYFQNFLTLPHRPNW